MSDQEIGELAAHDWITLEKRVKHSKEGYLLGLRFWLQFCKCYPPLYSYAEPILLAEIAVLEKE